MNEGTEAFNQEFTDVMQKMEEDVRFAIISNINVFDDAERKKMMAFSALGFAAGICSGALDAANGLEASTSPPFDTAISLLQAMKDKNTSILDTI